MKFKHPGEESEAACAMTAFIRSASQFNSRQVQSAGDAAIGYAGDYGKSPCYRLADRILQFEKRRRRIKYQGGAGRLWVVMPQNE